MDKHLNLFRFYSEKESDVLIENNLTRALALCLEYEPVFAQVFLSYCITAYKKQWFVHDGFTLNIDLQLQPKLINVELEEIEKIYAVSITPQSLSTDDFETIEGRETDNPRTDLVVQFNDVLIICEVKKVNEDCRAQLKGQVKALLGDHKIALKVEYVSLTWENIISFLAASITLKGNSGSFLIQSFKTFLFETYPQWFPVKQLSRLSYPKHENDTAWVQLERRLAVITSLINQKNGNEDSCYIPIKQSWAQRFQLRIDRSASRITLSCWPGDTKAQGWKLFAAGNKNWDWLLKHDAKIDVDGINGKLLISPYIKFAHFNRGTAYIGDMSAKAAHALFTNENFWKLSRKWSRESWNDFDKEMISFVGADWKERADWENIFENSNRNHVMLNMAAEVILSFDFHEISKMDLNDDALVTFFGKAMEKVIKLIET